MVAKKQKGMYSMKLSFEQVKSAARGVARVEEIDGKIKVTVTVKNVGDFDGKEVVKLFKSEKGAINQPIKSLIRFKKINLKKCEEIKKKIEKLIY